MSRIKRLKCLHNPKAPINPEKPPGLPRGQSKSCIHTYLKTASNSYPPKKPRSRAEAGTGGRGDSFASSLGRAWLLLVASMLVTGTVDGHSEWALSPYFQAANCQPGSTTMPSKSKPQLGTYSWPPESKSGVATYYAGHAGCRLHHSQMSPQAACRQVSGLGIWGFGVGGRLWRCSRRPQWPWQIQAPGPQLMTLCSGPKAL